MKFSSFKTNKAERVGSIILLMVMITIGCINIYLKQSNSNVVTEDMIKASNEIEAYKEDIESNKHQVDSALAASKKNKKTRKENKNIENTTIEILPTIKDE